MNFDHKILSLSSISKIPKAQGKKIVLAGGCFDILHFGHVAFMQKARSAGDILVLLLESDAFIERVKKKKPVHTQAQRAAILASLTYVDYVVQLPLLDNPDVDYRNIVKDIGPSIIAYTFNDSKEEQKKKLAQSVGAEVIVVPHLSSFSSSKLITYAPIFRD
jgi:rfaE bifunctional protein nucleotidyltransferase chain/domain